MYCLGVLFYMQNKKVGARGMHSEIQISCRKIKNRRLPFTGNA
jgi:hypothetical protein